MNITIFDPDGHDVRLAVQVMIQVAVVVGLAGGIAATLGRRSAATRHAVWLVALAAVLVGPAATVALDRAGWTFGVVSVSEPPVTSAARARNAVEPGRPPRPRRHPHDTVASVRRPGLTVTRPA